MINRKSKVATMMLLNCIEFWSRLKLNRLCLYRKAVIVPLTFLYAHIQEKEVIFRDPARILRLSSVRSERTP